MVNPLRIDFLAHRGAWSRPDEHNSEKAFRTALESGHGIETDIRDLDGELVIAHDIARQGAMPVSAFFELYRSYQTSAPLALNIKSDGLASHLRNLISRYEIKNYFVFDMSVPDTLGYLQRNLQVFTRRSEYETGSELDNAAQGLWLDSFTTPFVDAQDIAKHVSAGSAVAIVSPELHKKPHLKAWTEWRVALSSLEEWPAAVMLCTDLPDAAQEFFRFG